MKTMLLQSWVQKLKRPTYFIEMEMSPRQIWSRFVMIERGWKEEEIECLSVEIKGKISTCNFKIKKKEVIYHSKRR